MHFELSTATLMMLALKLFSSACNVFLFLSFVGWLAKSSTFVMSLWFRIFCLRQKSYKDKRAVCVCLFCKCWWWSVGRWFVSLVLDTPNFFRTHSARSSSSCWRNQQQPANDLIDWRAHTHKHKLLLKEWEAIIVVIVAWKNKAEQSKRDTHTHKRQTVGACVSHEKWIPPPACWRLLLLRVSLCLLLLLVWWPPKHKNTRLLLADNLSARSLSHQHWLINAKPIRAEKRE